MLVIVQIFLDTEKGEYINVETEMGDGLVHSRSSRAGLWWCDDCGTFPDVTSDTF
ncbi:hypothetical protein BDB13_2143 [Rhodococcus sp. OK302]|nr:hypothetical protein BDB13_2143 [Rhodococcus sp. OK302]